jgi:protein-L-isoaspartate O-methyltransferase
MTFDTIAQETETTTPTTGDEPKIYGRGTYSPDDNKLRIEPFRRLDKETYKRVKDAGYKWAPKQGVFFAPMWTPAREDILLELCGELEDDDISLAERAADRADRFEGYQANRSKDADSAYNAVNSIGRRFEMGQPILIGHHSEKSARRDQENMHRKMSKAVKMWDTAAYWQQRAANAIRHARYKELPAVRHRRIKGLEAEQRKTQKEMKEYEILLKFWSRENISLDSALSYLGYGYQKHSFSLAEFPRNPPASQYEGEMSIRSALEDGIIGVEWVKNFVIPRFERAIDRTQRWLNHYEFRLTYENAMLGESGGVISDKHEIKTGGKVKYRNEWLTILRINKSGGKISSLSVTVPTSMARFRDKFIVGVAEVSEYQEPTETQAEKVAKANKLPPLCNYPDDTFVSMTSAEWKKIHNDYKGTRTHGGPLDGHKKRAGVPDIKRSEDSQQFALHRIRVSIKTGTMQCVYISDMKRTDPPKAQPDAEPVEEIKSEIDFSTWEPQELREREVTKFDHLRDQLKQGIKIVIAPQLFVTPHELAARMVEMADLVPGQRLLEPSAGTGNILRAVREAMGDDVERLAVEINHSLCDALRTTETETDIHCRDFFQCGDEIGKFDRIVMNPPFSDADDIKHIKHALTMLKPGGKLVAICAGGPRQRDHLLPIVNQFNGTWESLPSGTFATSGTQVNTVLLSIST